MESRDVFVGGLWGFAIIALVGAIYGRLDGLFVLIFFIVAVVVSFSVVEMPTTKRNAP